MNRWSSGQIDTGYMYLSPHERLYRPTWKGAFLMTWGQLWPFKAIRQQRHYVETSLYTGGH